MEIIKRVLKTYNNNNHFPQCYMPLKERETTYFSHEKGIVGINFINDYFGIVWHIIKVFGLFLNQFFNLILFPKLFIQSFPCLSKF